MDVTIEQGTLRGLERDGYALWRGIPYAEPPVGELRWRAPAPGASWSGVREAIAFGPRSLQPAESLPSPETAVAEDCLYLNIAAPAEPAPPGGRPVLVWIHGGGYRSGSGDSHGEGDAFVDAGIVVVSFNYRLGALGFAHLGGIFGHAESDAGVCGVLDQLAALRWVKDNIAAFGGDPSRVTIYGVSAGAKSVGNLLASPLARGLFAQAISSSGGGDHVAAPEVGAALAARLLAELDCDDAAALRRIPGEEILAAQERIKHGVEGVWVWRPTLHREVLPSVPVELIAQGSAADVRLMLGNGGNEASTFAMLMQLEGRDPGAVTAPADEVLGSILGVDGAGALLAAIGHTRGLEDVGQRKLAAMGDERYGIPTQRMADAHARFADVYRYRFDSLPPGAPAALAGGHGIEVPMVWQLTADLFGNPIQNQLDPARAQVARQMHQAWTSFIHTGAPVANGLPVWPLYDSATRSVLIFDEDSRVEDDPRAHERLAWGDAKWPSGTWFALSDAREPAGHVE